MIEYIPLVVAFLVAVALVSIRTNAAIAFFAICAGSVLVSSSGDNLGLIASSLTSGMDSASNIAKIVLLLLPMLISSVLLRGQISKGMFILNLLPALCAGLLVVLFVTPLLPNGIESQVTSMETWSLLSQYKELVIGVGMFLSIVLISATTKKHKEKHKKH